VTETSAAKAGGEYPARRPGEDDKAYLKRVADELPRPSELPEDHALYFEESDARIVSIDRLRSSKSLAENEASSRNAEKFFGAARAGVVARRKPLSVRTNADGSFLVLDGNASLVAAQRLGWKTLPVKLDAEAEADSSPRLPMPRQ
jgi:hypothetical protein